MDGVIVVDKSEGWTSHDVVAKMRGIAKTKKVGHLGTLDPIATGVLPIVIERATRLSQFYTRSDKLYEGTVRFGFATSSYDRAGEPVGEPVAVDLTAQRVETALAAFRGEILQRPPAVSAKKVAGRRAYELARKHVEVELEPVAVNIYEIVLLDFTGDRARIRVRCSGGTYVRSIAHDLGQALGCGAHLEDLRRLASGEFEIAEARTLEQLQALADEGRLAEALVPSGRLLPALPTVSVDDLTVSQIRNGRNFQTSPFRGGPPAKTVKAISRDGSLVAIGELVLPNVYHPIVVL